ncbi:unnamed protein product [Dicrocoelium dendriticum]|nr:unnamed protein product [Dicrocoelium dendriticum]
MLSSPLTATIVPVPHSYPSLDIPADGIDVEEHEAVERDSADPDRRISIMAGDKAIQSNNEFYDDPDEEMSYPSAKSYIPLSRDAQSHRDIPKRARVEEDAATTITETGTGKKADSVADKTSEPKPEPTDKLESSSQKRNGVVEAEANV